MALSFLWQTSLTSFGGVWVPETEDVALIFQPRVITQAVRGTETSCLAMNCQPLLLKLCSGSPLALLPRCRCRPGADE